MIRQHTDAQVTERARQIDAGRRAGLTDEQLVELVGARASWHATGHVRLVLLTPTLISAAATPAALAWDAVFTTALRRTVRESVGPDA